MSMSVLTLKSLAASSSLRVDSFLSFSFGVMTLAEVPNLASRRALFTESFPSPGRLFPSQTTLDVNDRLFEMENR